MSLVSSDDYLWLVSAAAEPWLAGMRGEGGGASVALLSRLRKDLSAERAHLVVELVELRRRGQDKFADAQRMFFTRQGLEQATDERIAAVKADRFAAAGPLADLCCGIGGDAIALGRRARQCVGVDLDSEVAVLAAANLAVADVSRGSVESRDAASFPVGDFAAWHIDPDRRPAGRRTTQIEQYRPSLSTLDRLLAENPHAAIKLAPAAEAPLAWRAAAELCWLGSRGECRQQVAWFGDLARHAGQHAACIVDTAVGARTIVGQPDQPIPTAERLGRFLHEPHAAVLAARLVGRLCGQHALAALSPGVAYLTADVAADEPACEAFEVLDVLPLDVKQLRGFCRQQRIGRVEIKKRGIDLSPEKLRMALDLKGDEPGILVATRVAQKSAAIFVRRV